MKIRRRCSMSKLVIDSGADLTVGYVRSNKLIFMPMSYSFGEKSYLDDMGQAQSVRKFYDMLRDGVQAVTAQITPNQFMDTWRPYLEAGEDLLYLAFSSALSGTYQSAMLARENLKEEFPERRMIIVDTLAASGSQALITDYAARMFREGKDISEIAEWVEENKNRVHTWFTVDDMQHLHRGGRVSGTSAFVATMLSIKPVLHVNNEGKLINISKVRGRNKALNNLAERFRDLNDGNLDQRVFIFHADAINDAEYLAGLLMDMGVMKIVINYMGPVVGAHGGPGTVLLAFMGKDRQYGL